MILFWHSVDNVAADNYDANLASFSVSFARGIVMAWKVFLPTGTVEVGSADLKRMAADGTISKTTQIESTTNKVRTTAAGIAGLVFKAEVINILDLPIPAVPQTPPTWNPPDERREAVQASPWTPPAKSVLRRKSTFSGLFDPSFESMWTPGLLGMLWIAWLMTAIIAFVGSLFAAAFTGMDADGIKMIVASILTIIFVTIAVRVLLETVAVIFKICEYLKDINDRG